MNIAEMLGLEFMQNALMAGLALALCAALLGVCLVLRRSSMIGDGLSHAAFALATVFGILPLPFALATVTLLSFIVLRMSRNKNGDAAIAVLSASSLAVGTFAVSVAKGTNIDINSYLFGSILAVSRADAILAIVLTVIVAAIFVLCFHRIFALIFDEKFARTVGVKVGVYDAVFAAICSIVIIFPALTAIRLVKNFRSTVIVAAVVSVITVVVGLVFSYFWGAPAGSTIVLIDLVVFALACLARKIC